MRITFILIGIFYCGIILSQIPKPGELYHKIENYYRGNPGMTEYIERTFKSPLGHDTSYSRFTYIKLSNNIYMLAYLDSSFFVKSGLYYNDGYYSIQNGVPEKFRHKRKELRWTNFNNLDKFSSYSINNLENIFGRIKLIQTAKNEYRAVTTKYVLTIDTATYRITSLFGIVFWKGKTQTDRYVHKQLPDSSKEYIKEQVENLITSAYEFPTKTHKDMDREEVPATIHEAKPFVFKNLVTFNRGSIDLALKGKYVILDFFYQSCMPCHKMTGFILDWLPTIDSSKIILVGVDPRDSERSMKLFAEERGINYPIIIGQQAKDIVKHYGVHAYPTLFLLSPDGTIRNIHIGMSKSFLTKAEKIISR